MSATLEKLTSVVLAITLAASVTLAAATNPAVAAPLDPARSAVIDYDDLNLSSQTGVARLEARLRNAAERLCTYKGLKTPNMGAKERACIDQALADAEPQVRQAVAAQRDSLLASNPVALGN